MMNEENDSRSRNDKEFAIRIEHVIFPQQTHSPKCLSMYMNASPHSQFIKALSNGAMYSLIAGFDGKDPTP
jgi:hypothetical protein